MVWLEVEVRGLFVVRAGGNEATVLGATRIKVEEDGSWRARSRTSDGRWFVFGGGADDSYADQIAGLGARALGRPVSLPWRAAS
jgi:hypothetical protein